MKKILICLLLFVPLSFPLLAQDQHIPVLEREITLLQTNQSVQSILASISQQAGFVFSYNPDAINASAIVTINIKGHSVRHALNVIFNGTVTYKVKGKYIILQKNNTVVIGGKKEDQVIEGYVVDGCSGKKVTQTSVYDKDLMVSAITDEYGYFRIAIPSGQSGKNLHFSKEGFTDTTLVPLPGKTSFVSVALTCLPVDSISVKLSQKPSKADRVWMPAWLVSQKIRIHTRNLSDSIFKNVQFSFVPFVSTNKLLTARTINNYSVNMTAGVVQGVKKVEVGGMMNIVRDDVGFCQLAGIGNFVGGKVNGFQAAGVLNKSQSIKGVQAAGIVNIVRDETIGVQTSGILNISGKISGMQVAGICNIAGKVNGSQLSGILNIASSISGLQLSLINIADSATGVPIGLFSFVRNGYHRLEVSCDEVGFTSLAFRSGVQLLHGIFLTGVQLQGLDNPIMACGYGLGTSFGRKEKLLWDLDLTSSELFRGDDFQFKTHLYQIYGGIDKSLSKNISIAFGITFNALWKENTDKNQMNFYAASVPYTFSDHTFTNGDHLQSWAGVRISLRFF